MTTRMSNEARRRQIVEATLELLGEHPVGSISTRRVAERVGVTQPALFRHFHTRDAMLAAVVDHTREALGATAAEALAAGRPPLEVVEVLVRGLLGHVERHPGMPRLLFHDIAGEDEGRFRTRLGALVEMQRRLLARLVSEARDAGDVPAPVDPAGAARLLLASIQGVLLQWELGGRDLRLDVEAGRLLAMWRAGLRAGVPGEAAPQAPRPPPEAALVALDVRPLLAQGRDPLDAILAAWADVAPDGVLKLTAPFRPVPLLALFERRGVDARAREVGAGVWDVEVRGPSAPEPLDLRDGEPGEPLVRVLEEAAALSPGGALLARVPRVPRLLFPHLDARGLAWAVHEEADGTALLHVRRPR